MGRTAYLWCPAYPLTDQAQYDRAVGAAHLFAESVKLELVVSPLLTHFGHQGTWLPTSERLSDLKRGLKHQVLLAARGGYGCLDVLPALLDTQESMPALMGYSDISVFHALWRRKKWQPGWYGFMPGVTPGGRALSSAITLFTGDGLVLDHSTDPSVGIVKPGRAEGPIFPACLRVLAGLIGTPAMPDLTGHILALEDVDERPYQLDRDLNQLYLANGLQGITGLILGKFPCVQLPSDYAGPSAADIAHRWAERLNIPTLFGLPFGHDPDPVTLPYENHTVLNAHDDLWRITISPRPTL